MQCQYVLHYWFEELTAKQHLIKNAPLEAAARCKLFTWRATPDGRLAELIVFGQFSRNVYRKTPRSFAQDALARKLTTNKQNCSAQALLS